MKGQVFEFATVIGTVVFLLMLWTVLMKPTDIMQDSFKTMLPDNTSYANTSVNRTMVEQEIDNGYNVMYFCLFFFVIVIFVFAIKVANQYKDRMR